jgi:hypothetical protein
VRDGLGEEAGREGEKTGGGGEEEGVEDGVGEASRCCKTLSVEPSSL